VPLGAWFFRAAGHYTVFDDEAFSCLRYTMPPGEMVRALWAGVEPDPPLYYAMENLWVHAFGVGPVGLRSLSILLFLAGLLVMHRAGTAWFGGRVGNLTLLLCAIHPAHLLLGFAARWYSAMFLAVALLMWASAPPRADEAVSGSRGESSAGRLFGWSLCAAAACYTNYFGPVIVAFAWMVCVARAGSRRGWLLAGAGAMALYAPWLPAFWRQATSFPRLGGGAGDYASTVARSLAALLAGPLAGPRAWWVWAPMAGFCVAAVILLVHRRREVRPLAVIVAGCLLAGVATRTMIDKYVMTFSGPACMLAASLLATGRRATGGAGEVLPAGGPVGGRGALTAGSLRWMACLGLGLAWAGCGLNLVRERHWSSLRWLDPFEAAVRRVMEWKVPTEQWVATHPSARYYAALARLEREGKPATAANWVHIASFPPLHACGCGQYLRTPGLMLKQPGGRELPAIVTIESAGFADAADWRTLHAIMAPNYHMVAEQDWLEDPDAGLKDRLDPSYHHPRHRITARLWKPREGETPAPGRRLRGARPPGR
jgi:hypothetical protein